MNLDNIKELSQLQQEYLKISNEIKTTISTKKQEFINLTTQNYINFLKSEGFKTEETNGVLISDYMGTTIRLSSNLLKLEILKPITKSYDIKIKKFDEDYTPVLFDNPQTNEEILVEIDKLKKDIEKANETLIQQNGKYYFVLEEGNQTFNTFDALLEDVFK